MKFKIVLFVTLANLMVITLFARSAIVKNSQDEVFREFVLNHDPSSVAVSNDHQNACAPQMYLERWRIVTDLNNDGKDDLILSAAEGFGNSGGPWFVYISSNGYWRCIGDVGLYPSTGAFAFDAVDNEVDLWYYDRVAAGEGYVGYYTFSPKGMKKECNRIFVRGGNEEESIFVRLGADIFGYANKHPYRLEASETSTNGVVSWKLKGDWRKPGRTNELYELKQKLAAAEKRVQAAEEKQHQMSHRLYEYEVGVHQMCGITLGAKWEGGDKKRICKEEFSGFTNMTISVDSNNFVNRIRLTRNDGANATGGSAICGKYDPTDEEQKIIHQVENKLNIRFMSGGKAGSYSWGGPIAGTWINVQFADGDGADSYIEMRYSRQFNGK